MLQLPASDWKTAPIIGTALRNNKLPRTTGGLVSLLDELEVAPAVPRGIRVRPPRNRVPKWLKKGGTVASAILLSIFGVYAAVESLTANPVNLLGPSSTEFRAESKRTIRSVHHEQSAENLPAVSSTPASPTPVLNFNETAERLRELDQRITKLDASEKKLLEREHKIGQQMSAGGAGNSAARYADLVPVQQERARVRQDLDQLRAARKLLAAPQ